MEGLKGFFDSFKEFIWDIIGYFLPGCYLIMVLSYTVNRDYFVYQSIFPYSNEEFHLLYFIVLSYLLGYVIYGFGWFKEEILGHHSYVKKTELNVSKRKAFLISKEIYSKVLKEKGVNQDLNEYTSVRDLRSIVMSFIPEHDQKIYTFTFRSDLSNQVANVSFLIGVIGLASYLINRFICYFSIDFFKIGKKELVIYFCLLISYFFLRVSRNRFYAISIGLPFSIYSAKATKNGI